MNMSMEELSLGNMSVGTDKLLVGTDKLLVRMGMPSSFTPSAFTAIALVLAIVMYAKRTSKSMKEVDGPWGKFRD